MRIHFLSGTRGPARRARALRPAAYVERLEGRSLLAAAITEFPIPSSASIPGLTPGPDGNLWDNRVQSAYILGV
jgi:hypothetical protein